MPPGKSDQELAATIRKCAAKLETALLEANNADLEVCTMYEGGRNFGGFHLEFVITRRF